MTALFGKALVVTGLIIAFIGILFIFRDSVPFLKFLGKLPGDISIKRENFTFYFPLTTSILISLIATIIYYLVNKFR
jgi:predicted phosphohydrolase